MNIKYLTILLALVGQLSLHAAKTLDIYFIDVEAGSATLIVSPSGQSMLIDTGSPSMAGRDVAAIEAAGLKQLDYALITHFHMDHYGAIVNLAKRVPIRTFVDHGPAVEAYKSEEWKKAHVLRFSDELYDSYLKIRDGGKHLVAIPGENIPLKGVDVTVLTASGKDIKKPLPGAGAPNRWCESTPLLAEAENEDSQSVGTLIQYGEFRFIVLGDLTWNNGRRLVCPVNKVGPVDVFLTTHHAMHVDKENGGEVIAGYSACSKAEVWGLAPRVAVLNYGPTFHMSKIFGWFGGPEGWDTVRQSPGLETAWQMHYQPQGGKEHNVADEYIANLTPQNCAGHWLKLSASEDGSFTMTNSRTAATKQYQSRSKK
jgi:competence protein ComEC